MRKQDDQGGPLVPERVGPYEVLLPIASGGMATVYLARRTDKDGNTREVALKLTHAHLRTRAFAHEIMEEAKLASRISHPNVVPAIDVGDDPQGVYLIMDYVEGDTLSGLVRAGKYSHPLPIGIALRIVIDALAGLHAAHELTDEYGQLLNLVHRDFSPQNILVSTDGQSRLADFGVAKAASRTGHTVTGLVKGKIRYMSPEQARSDKVDRRTDVWAAGVILWELLANRRIYQDRVDTAMLLQLISQPPPRLRSVNPKVPQALDDAVHAALQMDPKRRCPTARQLAESLEKACQVGMKLPTADDVATHVRKVTEGPLRRRRQRIEEVLRLRAEMGRIAESATEREISTSHPGLRLPPFPDPEDSQHGSSTHPTAAVHVKDRPARTTVSPSTKKRRGIVAATVATMGVMATFFWLRSTLLLDNDRAQTQAVEQAVARAGSPVDGQAPGSSTPPSTPLTSVPTSDAPMGSASAAVDSFVPVKVRIVGSTPIQQLRVGARDISFGTPRTQIEIELTEEEVEIRPLLIAVSTDGRQASMKVDPETETMSLYFRPAVTSAPPPSAAASAATPAPLASSPYEH